MLIVLSLIWGVATVMTGFAGSVLMLVVLRFVLGIGEGGAFPTATRLYLLDAGGRARLRAGHHAQLCAARRRDHATDRAGHRGDCRLA
ncbi:hypothetical protein ACTMU2_40060 [Cupriavidus basilensis]